MGEPKAQYQLYRLYSKAMFNICYRMMNSREEAEDMLQEVFSEAFSKLDRFRFESAFGAWLKQITVNKCINELKRRKTQLVLQEDLSNYDYEEESADQKNLTLEVEKIHKAVGLLPDGYRVIFSLYLLEGYDHTEISEILGISESTSKSQYMRAKRKLIELLKNN